MLNPKNLQALVQKDQSFYLVINQLKVETSAVDASINNQEELQKEQPSKRDQANVSVNNLKENEINILLEWQSENDQILNPKNQQVFTQKEQSFIQMAKP